MRSTLTGLVSGTIEFSNVDGPGNRFVVFMQGCTFDCAACHNPYTISPCIDCGDCVPGCPSGALSIVRDRVRWDESLCLGGDECLTICPHDASPKALPMVVADLVRRIEPAAPFLSGITVSGGEATAQSEFVAELFAAVRQRWPRLTCFVDSNGDAARATWDVLAPVTDGVMVDLKCLDPQVHVEITGVSNRRTLASIEHLHARGLLWEVRLLMLPGLNDADDLLAATGQWLAAINPTMRLKVIGFRHHGVRRTALPLLEPSPAQRTHYAAVLAQHGNFEITVI